MLMFYLLQSPWTKRAIEVDSPKPMSPWDQVADPPDSTCAQVIHSRPESLGNNLVPVTITKDYEGQDDALGMHGCVCRNFHSTFFFPMSLKYPKFPCLRFNLMLHSMSRQCCFGKGLGDWYTQNSKFRA